jgi:hypothetical protein
MAQVLAVLQMPALDNAPLFVQSCLVQFGEMPMTMQLEYPHWQVALPGLARVCAERVIAARLNPGLGRGYVPSRSVGEGKQGKYSVTIVFIASFDFFVTRPDNFKVTLQFNAGSSGAIVNLVVIVPTFLVLLT